MAAEERGGAGAAGLLLGLSGHLLAVQEILSRPEIQRLASYRERRRGCREAYTWVRNKSGSKYWYWYLKCPGRRPSSVYLGSSPEAHRALMEAAGAVARVRRALAGLDLGGLAAQLAEAARRLEKLEAAAPAEAARQDASTPRRRRRTRGAPAEQTPTPQQENTRGEQRAEQGGSGEHTANTSPGKQPRAHPQSGNTEASSQPGPPGAQEHAAQERTRGERNPARQQHARARRRRGEQNP